MIYSEWVGHVSEEESQDRIVVNRSEESDKNVEVTPTQESETPKSRILNFKFGRDRVTPDAPFDLKANQKFYIDEIPESAKWRHWGAFYDLPDLEQQIYLLDDRWNRLDDDVPSWTQELTEIQDIHRNSDRDAYEWVCGFSVFFLKKVHNPRTEHAHRALPETHDRLIKGVQELVEYPDRCPEMVLRFYVSPEVFDVLADKGILYDAKNTEFYKMAYNSEESIIGATWRMLCLSDIQFEWAIEADCAPYDTNEAWIYDRIKGSSRDFFKRWLTEKKGFNWAGEFLFHEPNWTERQEELVIGNMENFDFLSGGGIVTHPNEMLNVETIIAGYVSERLNPFVFYHAGENVVSKVNLRTSAVPLGWEGFGPDQEMWRFVKKMMPVRHLIQSQSTDWMWQNPLPEDYFTKRIVSQLISEGSEFADIHTQAPIFNLYD